MPTVDASEGLLRVKPDLVRANSNDRSILFMKNLAQSEHAAIADMISMPYIGYSSNFRSRDTC